MSVCKKMQKSNRLQLFFAHIDEPISQRGELYAKPNEIANARLQRKQKARQLAAFFLRHFFQQNHLDLALLNQIERTSTGRPFIAALPELDFNISHSGEWVAVLCRLDKPRANAVGIDIEHPQKARHFSRLLRYYANEEERILLGENPRPDQFYLSWCLREAILKAQGVGIVKLSAVVHLPIEHKIFCDYCPKGVLHFYANLPFYLAAFWQQVGDNAHLDIFEWQDQQFLLREYKPTKIYAVNQ